MALSGTPHEHDVSYAPARGPVLLLSCMDPRLLDEVVQFMTHDNLTNRYDHVVLAGAALGALGGNQPKYAHWRQTFFDHLGAACELHQITDVYIIEHRGCGAYSKVFKVASEFGESPQEQKDEAECHRVYVEQLAAEIKIWGQEHDVALQVKGFLMDLRGKVSLIKHRPRTRA